MKDSSINYNLIERIMDSYISPSDKDLHKIFMPLSQYPKIYGLSISLLYKEVIAENASSFNLEFIVEDDNQYDIDLLIGKFNIKLIKNIKDKRGRVYYLDEQIASLPVQNHFTICMRIIESKLYLAINERRLFCLKEGTSNFELEFLSIKLKNKKIFLLSHQIYDMDYKLQVKEFGYLNNTVTKEIYNTSPKYVLLWEHRAKELYHALLLAHDLISNKLKINDKLEKKIYFFADLVFKMLTAWPKWRPSSYTALGEGGWETNNWCNGYIPGAYALASKILRKENFDDFFTKGLNWLVDKRNVQDIKMIEKFPPVIHWVNRSTNHGIVILSTILVGACVLGVFEDKRVELIYNDIKDIISKAFIDGSYLESVSYFQFVILELIPLFYHLSKLRSLTFAELAAKDFKELSSSLMYINSVTNHSTSKYFAVYGDCEPNHKWFASVLLFVTQLTGEEEPLSFEFDMSNGRNELYYQFVKFDNECNKETYETINIQHKFFENNSFIWVKHHNLKQKFYIWINGSKLHKTHNKDNDLGSFYLDDNQGSIFVKKQGLDIRNHNVVTIKEIMIDDEIVSANDLDIQEYSSPRNVNGNIEIFKENNDLYVFKHNSYSYFKYNDMPLIEEHIRFYVILKGSDFNLIIVDKVISSHKILCEARFHISSDLEFYRDKYDGGLVSHRVKVNSIGHAIELRNSCILNTNSEFSEVNMLITSIRSKDSTTNEEDVKSIIKNCEL